VSLLPTALSTVCLLFIRCLSVASSLSAVPEGPTTGSLVLTCQLAAVCCLLSAVCCLLSAVCCLLSAACLSAVCCLLRVCLLSAVCCLLSAVCCVSVCCNIAVTSFKDFCATHCHERANVVTLLLHCCYTAVTQLPHSCHTVRIVRTRRQWRQGHPPPLSCSPLPTTR
jgi:hypothetical protein